MGLTDNDGCIDRNLRAHIMRHCMENKRMGGSGVYTGTGSYVEISETPGATPEHLPITERKEVNSNYFVSDGINLLNNTLLNYNNFFSATDAYTYEMGVELADDAAESEQFNSTNNYYASNIFHSSGDTSTLVWLQMGTQANPGVPGVFDSPDRQVNITAILYSRNKRQRVYITPVSFSSIQQGNFPWGSGDSCRYFLVWSKNGVEERNAFLIPPSISSVSQEAVKNYILQCYNYNYSGKTLTIYYMNSAYREDRFYILSKVSHIDPDISIALDIDYTQVEAAGELLDIHSDKELFDCLRYQLLEDGTNIEVINMSAQSSDCDIIDFGIINVPGYPVLSARSSRIELNAYNFPNVIFKVVAIDDIRKVITAELVTTEYNGRNLSNADLIFTFKFIE